MVAMQDIVRAEIDFPASFANVEKRPYGISY